MIRGWPGHAGLDTTSHYAQATLAAKREAPSVCIHPLRAPR